LNAHLEARDGAGGATTEERAAFERWAVRAACEIDSCTRGSLPEGEVGYEEAFRFLLSEKALGAAPRGAFLEGAPGLYANAWGFEERRRAGEDLLYLLYYVCHWREAGEPGAGERLQVYWSCDPEPDTGMIAGIDPTPKEGAPLGAVAFRDAHVYLTDLGCDTEADLYGVYRRVLAAGLPHGLPEGAS
jgi:hypothetical protein